MESTRLAHVRDAQLVVEIAGTAHNGAPSRWIAFNPPFTVSSCAWESLPIESASHSLFSIWVWTSTTRLRAFAATLASLGLHLRRLDDLRPLARLVR